MVGDRIIFLLRLYKKNVQRWKALQVMICFVYIFGAKIDLTKIDYVLMYSEDIDRKVLVKYSPLTDFVWFFKAPLEVLCIVIIESRHFNLGMVYISYSIFS